MITHHASRITVNGRTQLLGIIGWPVAHSFSPAMHNAALADLGLDYVYVPLPVHPEEVNTAVPALPTLGFRGVNVTVPHKQAVMSLLDELEDAAQAIGAIRHGKRACALSWCGALSFYPTKNLGGFGDAGAVCTDDDELLRLLEGLSKQ